MSKEHYVTPEKFDEMEKNDEIFTIGYFANHKVQNRAEIVINGMREINKKDTGFVYTCVCNSETTLWRFGYKDESVYNEADEKIDELILQSREAYGEVDTDVYGGYNNVNMSACVCPFDM